MNNKRKAVNTSALKFKSGVKAGGVAKQVDH